MSAEESLEWGQGNTEVETKVTKSPPYGLVSLSDAEDDSNLKTSSTLSEANQEPET